MTNKRENCSVFSLRLSFANVRARGDLSFYLFIPIHTPAFWRSRSDFIAEISWFLFVHHANQYLRNAVQIILWGFASVYLKARGKHAQQWLVRTNTMFIKKHIGCAKNMWRWFIFSQRQNSASYIFIRAIAYQRDTLISRYAHLRISNHNAVQARNTDDNRAAN